MNYDSSRFTETNSLVQILQGPFLVDCVSVGPDYVMNMLAKAAIPGAFVAGGSCISIVDPHHQFNDIDIFVNNEEAYRQVEQLLVANGFNPASPCIDSPMTGNIINFTNDVSYVQVIPVPDLQSLSQLLSNFDFEVCRIGFDHERIMYGRHTVPDIESKTINLYPEDKPRKFARLLSRLWKYQKKGFEVHDYTFQEIVSKITDSVVIHDPKPLFTMPSMNPPFIITSSVQSATGNIK